MTNDTRRTRGEARSLTIVRALWWLGALTAAAVVLALAGYTSRDADSTLYSEISGRMSAHPFSTWIAPDWEGTWTFSGPFREHPIGNFVLPALLGRAGYPAQQAAFAVGALLSALAIWLLKLAVTPLVREHEATAVQWAALILPIAFVYRVRATQEYPVLVLTLFAIYATERSRRSAVWIVGIIGASCLLTVLKGIFVVFLPTVCGLWLLLIRGRKGDGAAWVGVVLAGLVVLPVTWMYELAYRHATGDSFLSFYVNNRIAENAGLASERSFNIWTKLYNVIWYGARVAWFALPGSLVLLLSARRVRSASADDLRGIWFALLAAAVYVAAMSLGANKADRFIFPAYFFVGTAGAVVAMRRWAGVDRFARKLAALPPYALPLTWLVLFMLTLTTEDHLWYVKVWTS